MFTKGKQKVFLSFNKLTGAHFGQRTGGSEDNLPDEYLKWRVEEFDPSTHRWVGDYEDGKVMAIAACRPYTNELMMDEICSKKIEKKYQWYHQTNALAAVVGTLIKKGILTEEDAGVTEFLEQREYIDRALKNNELYKEARTNSQDEDYRTKEELDRKKNDQVAGGLNTVLGRF